MCASQSGWSPVGAIMCASQSAGAQWGLYVCQPDLLEPFGAMCVSAREWLVPRGECMCQPEWLEPNNKCIIIFHSMSLVGLCQVAMLVVSQ